MTMTKTAAIQDLGAPEREMVARIQENGGSLRLVPWRRDLAILQGLRDWHEMIRIQVVGPYVRATLVVVVR